MQTIEDYIEREYRGFPVSKVTNFMSMDYARFLKENHVTEFFDVMDSELISTAKDCHAHAQFGDDSFVEHTSAYVLKAIEESFKQELIERINNLEGYDEAEENKLEEMSFNKERLA